MKKIKLLPVASRLLPSMRLASKIFLSSLQQFQSPTRISVSQF
jgi:hypothetical protein